MADTRKSGKPKLTVVRAKHTEKVQIVDNLNENIARCQTWGHNMNPWSPPETANTWVGSNSVLLEFMRCERCGTTRMGMFNRFTGERIGNYKYDWPKQYKEVKLNKREWRVNAYAMGLHERSVRKRSLRSAE